MDFAIAYQNENAAFLEQLHFTTQHSSPPSVTMHTGNDNLYIVFFLFYECVIIDIFNKKR